MAPEPEVVWMPGGVRTEIHLTGADTDGAFCLLIDEPPTGWSLPAHIHTDATETIHVLAGESEMTVGGITRRLRAGDTIHVPAGVVHAGGNVSDAPGRRLIVFAPAGMEEFFREVGTASSEAEVDPRTALDSALRHGWRFVG
ncbi:MAG: cupin domain-containing protein [Actinobacteria bacterium]|nr:cupin domain-containing protein [Actinomycetota bacterium]